MKIAIEQKIFELDRKLQNMKAQYQLQIDELTASVEKEKCMLSMALNSPLEFTTVNDIVVPKPEWINPETIPSEPSVKKEFVLPEEELESLPVV